MAVTGQVTFGDLLDVARRHLGRAAALPGRPQDVSRELPEIRSGMNALITEIGRCLPGNGRGNGRVLPESGGSSSPWPVACEQARRAAARAAHELPAPPVGARRDSEPVTERGRHLHASARALAAGRDLLATHVGAEVGDEQVRHSAWAAAVSSPAIGRAVAAEMAVLARQAAALGAGLATMTPGDWAVANQARRDLAAASGYLRILVGAITAARRQEPVLASDRALLRAIPVAGTVPRRLPGSREAVAALCEGVVNAAERLRHSAGLAARQAGSSPDFSTDSLRHAAAAAVATSHHCSVLLGTLQERAEIAGGDGADTWARFGLTMAMAEASQAAGRARDGWLHAARTLDQVTSDVRDQVGPETADTRDLALWTGRLAYADPQWTPASGPRATARPAAELALEPHDVPIVVATVHYAADALTRLAEAHEQQARSAAQAERFLVPAGPRAEPGEATRPYSPASPERVAVVMSAWRRARVASSDAEARIAVASDAVMAPSLVLARARELAAESASGWPQRGTADVSLPSEAADYGIVKHTPGPVERSLQMLGVDDAERIRAAIAIDRAGEQLIEACAERDPRRDAQKDLATAMKEATPRRRARVGSGKDRAADRQAE